MSGGNIKSSGHNTSESMGQLGNFPISAATKEFTDGEQIAVIYVSDGTATVPGRQHVQNTDGKDIYPDWSAIVLPVGTHIVNLKNVTIVASGLTIVYYGA